MTSGPAVRVLGPVLLTGPDGEQVTPPGALPQRLVVALALAGAEGRAVAGLVEDVWPDREPRNPRAALQMLVSRVRAAAGPGAVESTPAGYRVRDADLEVAERAGESDAAAALALWRGEPGADLEPSPLSEELVSRAARARRRLLGLEGGRLLRGGSPEAVPVLERLVETDPLDGSAVRALMRAHAGTGAGAAATAAFARHREALAEALGADPAAETIALNTELLRGGAQPAPHRAALVGVRAASTALLGREDDVRALVAAVPDHRLTSIVGTGGLGKTRLAQEVAGRLTGRFDRIVFTELAGARAAEDVALVVGAAVGARPAQATRRLGDPPPADLPTRTREALGAARTLLVLDNCEHLVDAAARLTADLLAEVPSLTVLTTSRVPLLLAGEHVVAPRPLDATGAGSALFTARATAARPDVRLDPALVARVCARLDGLPLAIELAAARLRSMSLAELDRRLADRFALLVGGDRTAPERHRTLLAVIDWSRRLLSPAAQEALAALAVLPDGFTARTAADVLDADATEVLTELVDQSLLRFDESAGPDGRYRMLETVREFGLRRLADSGRARDAERGLDRWALRFARRVSDGLLLGGDLAAGRALAAEEETLLAVLRADPAGREEVVVAVYGLLAEHWTYRGDFEAAFAAAPVLLRAAHRRPTSADERIEAVRALALASTVTLLSRSPAGPRALALLRRTLATGAVSRAFWEVTARELLLVGALGDTTGADRLATDGDPVIRAFGLAVRAQLLENAGEAAEALAVLQRVDALTTQLGLQWLRIFSRVAAVSLRSQRGEHRRALEEALALREDARALDSATNLQQLDWLIASAEVALGELDAAEAHFRRLLTVMEQTAGADAADVRALAVSGLAEVATARGAAAVAIPAWTEALAVVRRASGPWRVVVLAASLAARLRLGLPPAALARDFRRLRGLLLALARLNPQQTDAPIFGAGLLGLAAVLRSDRPATARELLGLALALGARRDLASLDAVVPASGVGTPAVDREGALRRAIDVLRSPAVRR